MELKHAGRGTVPSRAPARKRWNGRADSTSTLPAPEHHDFKSFCHARLSLNDLDLFGQRFPVLAPAGMLGAPDDLQPSLVSAAGTTEIAAPFVTRVLLEHGSSPRGLEMRVVMVVMVMMVVMMIVEILRQLRIGFALRRLGFVHFLEESERVGDGLEQLREGLGLQEFTHIRGARRCRLRTVQGRDGGYNPHRASKLLLHLITPSRTIRQQCPSLEQRRCFPRRRSLDEPG
jgi:hypothetical protein